MPLLCLNFFLAFLQSPRLFAGKIVEIESTPSEDNRSLSIIHVSAKMFENPDVSGLLSLHQWKMPLH